MTTFTPITTGEAMAHAPVTEGDQYTLSSAQSNLALDEIADEFPGISAAVWTPDGIVWHAERGSLSVQPPAHTAAS